MVTATAILKDKYKVSRAYLFVGYVPKYQDLYNFLRGCGFILVFKPISIPKDGEPKGNVDADLVLHAMINIISQLIMKSQ